MWLNGGYELVRSIIRLYKKSLSLPIISSVYKTGTISSDKGVEIPHAIPVNRGLQISQRPQKHQIDLTPVKAGLEALKYHVVAQ